MSASPLTEIEAAGQAVVDELLGDPLVLVETLQQQLIEAYDCINYHAEVITAAKLFVELMVATHAKTGDPVFKLTNADDETDPIVATFNHRFSDLTALLNRRGRPIPPKLAQGTVH